MNKVKYRLTLDLEKPGIQHTIYAKRGDAFSREVVFTLREGVLPYILTDDVNVYAYALADDAEIFADCEITDTGIVVPLTTNMLAADHIIIELRLTGYDDALLTSPQIQVYSEDTIYSEDAITATNEFSALLRAIAAAENSRIVDIHTEGSNLVIVYADGKEISVEFETVRGPRGHEGRSAYEVWLDEGYEGDEEEFLESLKGLGISSVKQTTTSTTSGGWQTIRITLDDGTFTDVHFRNGYDGKAGDKGLSSYEEWLKLGNEGDEEEFLDSLKGKGISSIVRTGGTGQAGSRDQYTITYTDATKSFFYVQNGANGMSAYELWLDEGYEGEIEDFFEWLKADSIPFIPGNALEFTEDGELNVDVTAEIKVGNQLPVSSSAVARLAEDLRDETPKNTSALTNDSGFITRLVADLANYYTKSQTFTREEINALVSAIPKFAISVVSALPTANISTTTVYLVKTGTDSDLYTEWIYVNGEWEVLGSQRVDLTGYATEVYVQDYAQPKGNYALKSEIPDVPVQSVNGKTGAVNLNADDVGARADNWMPTAEQVGAMPAGTKIPTKVSQLTNDKGYLTSFTESDPTVPAWAKQPNKPSYSKSEVGLSNVDNVKQYSASNPPPYPVTSVNGKTGDVTIDVPDVSGKANKSDAETWTFTLEDGSVVTKKVVLA